MAEEVGRLHEVRWDAYCDLGTCLSFAGPVNQKFLQVNVT